MGEVSYDNVAEILKRVAIERSEWAGLPIPIPDHELILEPKFPYQKLSEISNKEEFSDWRVVNSWYSRRLRGNVLIGTKDGRVRRFLEPNNPIDMLIGTAAASVVWPLDAELKALGKLSEVISEHLYRTYLMTGVFLETSKRSGVIYIFRKLRPTLALKATEGEVRYLCAMCLHPIGYYDRTWAGVMVPTDDVLAHLFMMRGDEPKFWAHANQHPIWAPQTGL